MIDQDLEALDGLLAPATEVPQKRPRPRRTAPRAKTIQARRLTRAEERASARLEPWADVPRPSVRRECLTAEEAARQGAQDGAGDGANCERPCPFVSCRHHLYLDINPETGSIKLNFPHLAIWELKETCSLDVADRGGATLEEVGELSNLTRERIRQLEVRGLLKLKQIGVSLR